MSHSPYQLLKKCCSATQAQLQRKCVFKCNTYQECVNHNYTFALGHTAMDKINQRFTIVQQNLCPSACRETFLSSFRQSVAISNETLSEPVRLDDN